MPRNAAGARIEAGDRGKAGEAHEATEKVQGAKGYGMGQVPLGFIAIVFAVSTLTIIPIASAALGSSTDSELMQEAEKEKKEKSSGQEDSAKVIEKAEITTLALEDEKDEQPAEPKSTITGYRASLSQTELPMMVTRTSPPSR